MIRTVDSARFVKAVPRDLPVLREGWLPAGWRVYFGEDLGETSVGVPTLAWSSQQRSEIVVLAELEARFTTEQLDQLVRHEVAHALTPGAYGHNMTWRRKGRELGYRDWLTFVPPEHEREPSTMNLVCPDRPWYGRIGAG